MNTCVSCEREVITNELEFKILHEIECPEIDGNEVIKAAIVRDVYICVNNACPRCGVLSIVCK